MSKGMSLKLPVNIIVLGRTNTGKNVMLEWLMSKIGKQFKGGLVYAPTHQLNNDFHYIPEEYIYENHELFVSHLDDLVSNQIKLKKEGINHPVFVVVNDFVGDFDAHYLQCYDRLFTKGRHSNITTIFLTQSMAKLSTTMRENCGYYIVTRTSGNNYGYLYEQTCGFLTKKELENYMESIKERYSITIFDNVDPYALKPYVTIGPNKRKFKKFKLQY